MLARRRMIAVALAIIGVGLVTRPESYRSPTYSVLFDLAPPEAWGIAFLAVAVVAGTPTPRTWALPIMAGHLFAWSAGLAAATLNGQGVSPTAFVWPALVAVLVLHSTTLPPERPR